MKNGARLVWFSAKHWGRKMLERWIIVGASAHEKNKMNRARNYRKTEKQRIETLVRAGSQAGRRADRGRKG